MQNVIRVYGEINLMAMSNVHGIDTPTRNLYSAHKSEVDGISLDLYSQALNQNKIDRQKIKS